MCCIHHVRAWLSALCWATACAPHPGGGFHLWGGLQKHEVPAADAPMDPSQWELGGVGWDSSGPPLCFPPGHWGRKGSRAAPASGKPTRSWLQSKGCLALRSWAKPSQLWDFIFLLLCWGIDLHREFVREQERPSGIVVGLVKAAGVVLASAASVFHHVCLQTPQIADCRSGSALLIGHRAQATTVSSTVLK